jgi:Tol biopolymer transport system component
METDARTITQITNEPQPVVTLDISATGKLAYVSQYQIFVVDTNGQNRQGIANLESDVPARKLAWSPDGNRLAYPSKGVHVYDLTTGEDKLLIADKDTQAPDLVRYEPLEWSPDGSKLTVTKYLGKPGIAFFHWRLCCSNQQVITWNPTANRFIFSILEWTATWPRRGATTGEHPSLPVRSGHHRRMDLVFCTSL